MVLGLLLCSAEGAFWGVRQKYDTKKKTGCVYDTDTTVGGQMIFLSSRLFFLCRFVFLGGQCFPQRLNSGVVINFGQHLHITVAQQPDHHERVHALGHP